VLIMIVVDLVGLQQLFGVSLNAISLLIATSGVGNGVEFLCVPEGWWWCVCLTKTS
jgi:hypothetical protein